ncbi:MAG: substrate-binding domain-containing protein [Sphaerochaetaceae bacterium]|jgi:AraC-like DNA-binding protein|nr:substrate-binding domain-containing protein [Sphaerochaetaceae bacterium]
MRIGLVLASIHTGSSTYLWPAIAQSAMLRRQILITFPGGKIKEEARRNRIYDLIGKSQLDSLLCWGSSLTGAVTSEGLRDLGLMLGSKSVVTLSFKNQGCPNIEFDAYGGMKSLVNHFIKVHGARRIAFLRGPENHESAQVRYRAYLDALSQAGLEADPLLITDPMGWNEGASACTQLIARRHLVPGKDFEALVGASDLMVYFAEEVLRSSGYRIPEDIMIGGFNDSTEALAMDCSLTTVRMPYTQMAENALDLLVHKAQNPDCRDEDALLGMEVIIRRSCGCKTVLGQKSFESTDDFGNWICKRFRISLEERRAVIEPLLTCACSGQQASYDERFKAFVQLVLDKKSDVILVMEVIRLFTTLPFFSRSLGDYITASVMPMVAELEQRNESRRQYLEGLRDKLLNELRNELLCIRSLDAIPAILLRILKPLGFASALLVTTRVQEESQMVGGYWEDSPELEREAFSADLLVPQRLLDSMRSGVYVVEPLFMEDQELGYVVLKTTSLEGRMIEDLRATISSAVKGALLYEQAISALQAEQRANDQRDEFLAGVGDGIRSPLMDIAGIAASIGPSEISSRLLEQSRKVSRLLDLALSKTGALELSRTLFDPSFLAPGSRLAAIYADRRRIQDAFEAFKEGTGCAVPETRMTIQGNELLFRSSAKVSIDRGSPMDFASSIIALSSGTVEAADEGLLVVLPYPRLGKSDNDAIRVLWTVGCTLPFGTRLASVKDIKASDALAFSACDDVHEVLGAVSRLSQCQGMAIACLDCPDQPSLSALLDSMSVKQGLDPVLLWRIDSQQCSFLPRDISIERLEGPFTSVLEALRARRYSLLVCGQVDEQGLRALRADSLISEVPALLFCPSFKEEECLGIFSLPRILISSSCMADNDDFAHRMLSVISGTSDILPANTGVIVKRAILFIESHATLAINRWQIADVCHVSEDYLTRIFKRELGFSPWDYLGRYRVSLAENLLRTTSLTINEISWRTGFQDQAYFSRVFKKIRGMAPGKVRS